MRIPQVLLALIVPMVVVGCTDVGYSIDTPVAAGTSKTRINRERLSRTPSRMQQFVDDGKMAGAVMLLAVEGQVVLHEAVGYQDVDTRTSMSVNSLFQIQSMTKPVTAVATMILVEDGSLRLSDPVAKYLPEFRTRDSLRNITVLHLLTHSSGLPHGHLSDRDPPNSDSLAAVVADNAKATLLFESGEARQYSNLGIETLGRVIEVISEKRYDEFLMERILGPLEMNHTFFRVPPEEADRVANIYSLDGSEL